MLQKTRGIALRAVKYGESSLVATIFTEHSGVEAYMVKGARAPSRRNRAGSFQPAALLDMVVYRQPEKNMQYIRELAPAYIYRSVQEDVVKNSIVLFSAEVLLRLLPERAPLPALFDFAFTYFISLDVSPLHDVANFPLFFVIQCSRILGFELTGSYSSGTPYLDLLEGGFTKEAPVETGGVNDEDAAALSRLLATSDYKKISEIPLSSAMRLRLTDWYILFLQRHTQHMGNIRSLAVLRMVLHS